MECNEYRIVKYAEAGVSFEAFRDALGRLGAYLPYSLEEMQVDLDAYARKLVAHACVDICLSPEGRIVGIQAYYANDMETRKAYATFFSLDPECRGTGIAKVMMQSLVDTAKAKGMSVMEGKVARNNARAQALYEKFGFAVTSEASAEKVIMSRRLD
ncbi:MAG: GNAT family N-acetyltransferase [Kiritimatiellaeota bacterium]|nr:GNAT family N-acetyltransferase [Kiritimatiellota bacterium]